MTPAQSLALATEHHLAGRLADAETLYRQVLLAEPRNAGALHRLGILALQTAHHRLAEGLFSAAIVERPDAANYHCSLAQAQAAMFQWNQAVASYEKSISLDPNLLEGHSGLGAAFQALGNREQALQAHQRAVELKPADAAALVALGNAWFGLNRVEEAASAYVRALAIQPDSVEALTNLASAHQAAGNTEESVRLYQLALQADPNSAPALNNFGNVLTIQKKFTEAIAQFRKALEINPNFPQAAYNLANALWATAKVDEAIHWYRQAIEYQPDYVDAHNNLGNALQSIRDYKAAAESYLRALKIRPDSFTAYNNLGTALRTMGATDEAIAAFQQAIKLRPTYHLAWGNLANAQKDAGEIDVAIASFRRAIELNPRDAISHSNLVFSMQYSPAFDGGAILNEALRWNVLHAVPLRNEIQPHRNESNPNRRLRIGYLGADFREHCQSMFTIPLFANHDRAKFEIFCYSNVSRSDAVTERIQSLVDAWRSLRGISDADAAQLIRDDQIDILVDLTMHMSDGRPRILARKPAPIQIAWLAYPGTTGLSAMDYRISDPYLDPPGGDETVYSEKTIRLPDTFWCYDPLTSDPSPGELPAIRNQFITFGSLNNFCKVSPQTLETWSRILAALPASRLLLLAGRGKHRERVREVLERKNIAADRVEFVEFQPRSSYLDLYRGIDIGLDTLPYNGHTTSLDSFWMGVPVVTQVGRTVVGRAGLSQLQNLGLPELVAHDEESFVHIAVELAKDLTRLAQLRATLRERMINSPLMDAPRFARNMESLFREIWTQRCANPDR